jgi:arylsulfatase A-like enzyme
MKAGCLLKKKVLYPFLGIIMAMILLNCAGFPKDKALNIILIPVDDLNDWVACLGGHPQVKTPNIDRLAARGVLFANAHCQTAICNPSRSSLMTSLYPSTSGIYFNAGRLKDSPIAVENVVMTRRFENEGYHVTAAGKLFHAGVDTQYMDHYAGNFGGFGPLPAQKFTSFPGSPLWDWGIYPERDEQMPDYKIAEWGMAQLDKTYGQPLFLGLGFYRPHVPNYVPQKWFDLYPEESTQLPKVDPEDLNDISAYAYEMTHLDYIRPAHPYHEWIMENDQWLNFVRSYLASISFVDHQIGKFLDALENSYYRDNTFIVLFGDHGFHLGEKEAWAKQTLWENGTRTPLIIVGPGIPQGKICAKPVQLLDIYPTLLELTGCDADPKHEGHSLVPLLQDVESDWPYMARISFGPGNYAIRSERYRYIHYDDGSEEFYDHQKDPNEWENQIHNTDLNEIINTHRAFLPEKSHPVIGAGSTGHKIYDSLKVWFQPHSALVE